MAGRSMEPSNKKVAPGKGKATSENIQQPKNTGIGASAQRARLLAALRIGPITTLEARRTIDVLHPAARIQTLREAGHNIVTVWTRDVTSEGNSHRVAKYVLMPGSPA